ncbi:MAG TPA: DUF2809 domain-containing protein [Saprospiraceae bacterium]|nr:DUF2809 domain-containing protein [Saprospiraceae bacterium]HPI05838.1 DUF2809 domain-containing protein [Saprospiraceae bacterium]
MINRHYFLAAVLLFAIEVLIALYMHDRFVRPYMGDFLVVILIYCVVRAFVDASVLKTALFVLLFSYTIEVLQYFQIVQRLGLQHVAVARIVIGTSFEWGDLLAYTGGVLLVLLLEKQF